MRSRLCGKWLFGTLQATEQALQLICRHVTKIAMVRMQLADQLHLAVQS
jgi:hypothetical protein